MYEKNLTEDLRLRLSSNDMDFLRNIATERNDSISSVIRSIIGEYRRSIEMISSLTNFVNLANQSKGEQLFNGNTKTDIDNKL